MRQTRFLVLLVLLVACRPKLEDEQPKVKIPSSLPVFVQEPIAASVVYRATDLANEATVALAQQDVAKAIPLLTEALTVDGSHEQARWLLARTFLEQGRGTVALQLIAPLAEHQKDCGWCIEFLQKVRSDKAFEHIAQSAEGHALLADVAEKPLPYAQWATTLATAIRTGNLPEVAKFAHISLPFAVVRSCPDCADLSKHEPQRRELLGQSMLTKVASRFDLVRPENAGIPLTVQGDPQCVDRCCTWQTPRNLGPATAALARVCLRPTLPQQATVSEIALVFGSSQPRVGAPTLR